MEDRFRFFFVGFIRDHREGMKSSVVVGFSVDRNPVLAIQLVSWAKRSSFDSVARLYRFSSASNWRGVSA